jgi:hypothetical protein
MAIPLDEVLAKLPASERAAIQARAARAEKAADLLKQLRDPTRFAIMSLLAGGEMQVGAICDALAHKTPPAVSHQLRILRTWAWPACAGTGNGISTA